MASAKEIKRKIRSTSNTRKITRTLEMVATAKAKRTQSRLSANTPYAAKLEELLESLSSAGTVRHWLLDRPEECRRNALLVVTANRGFCGGYNSAVLQLANAWVGEEAAAGRETDISMVGKKGLVRARFAGVQLYAHYTHIEDRPSFREADELARGFMERLKAREVDRVIVASTRYYSAGRQRPALTQLLPIPPQRPGERTLQTAAVRGETDFLFEPDPESILAKLLPFAVSSQLFRLLIEAAASEQIARRMAMKLATDNAAELIRKYTLKYNRQRQAKITQQITEIVNAGEALE